VSETTIRGTIEIPEAQHAIPPTPREDIDRALKELQQAKDAWVATDVATRIDLLDQMLDAVARVADRWVEQDLANRGIDPDSPASSEGWYGSVLLIRNIRLLRQALEDIETHGRPKLPGEVRSRPDGQVVAEVFPTSTYDQVLFTGVTAEVWMQPHVTVDSLFADQAAIYQTPKTHEGKVAAVLGAGNVSAIPPMDAISKLFCEDQVVVLKMNPVNEVIGPIFEDAMRPLIDAGVLRLVYGGADEGSYLVHHDQIDTIHMTGSDKTFEAIVFGPGEEGRRRKAERDPKLDKPITAELGNVTPIIVVPGPWSDGDVDYHAENIATMLTNNAGFNCIAGRVIITHREWGRRRALLDAIRTQLARAETRHAYYPGAEERQTTFLERHPQAELYGSPDGEDLPWAFIPEVDPDAEDEITFNTEAFCGIFAETPLDAPRDIPAFIDRAVEFANERLWGTLGATLLIHPRTLKDPEVEAALDRGLANLRYGSVSVNHWVGIAYALVSTPWGAYPGSDLTDIQSGIGHVHNFYLLKDPEKSVVRAPFRVTPKPAWFVGHRYGHHVAAKLAEFEVSPSPVRLAPLVFHAARSW
jgi:acyl-CoA reductase-like NAD-dependent aldehyde dehydrogenase